MKYLDLSKELVLLLEEDQKDWKSLGKLYWTEGRTPRYLREREALYGHVDARLGRALEILRKIGEPSLSNIGRDGSVALSVLAIHASREPLEEILAAFQKCYDRDKDDCAYDLIPAMLDWVLVQKGQPQEFGTQWLFDEEKYPFLPTVARFTTVVELNSRRAAYGREPYRWPKSLAIPEDEQPWLKRPLSEAVMRMPAEDELDRITNRK
ncbi:hypothetical protein [Streptacidiphilus sp. EB103A]|uniref:hypothetical protein n=1 Tax=Streptacidiphilus sp. EB103A TaxID=3156275 RepID=UPI0035198AC2